MQHALSSPLRNLTRGWPLYFILAAFGTVQIWIFARSADLGSMQALSALTANSARWAAFFLSLAFVASSLRRLAPSRATTWLLSNRRYFGLLFPYFTLGQWLFIAMMKHNRDGSYWWFLKDPSFLQSPIYTFSYIAWGLAAAMTLTSFNAVNRGLHVRPRQWRLLHKTGMLYLAGYFLITYVFYWSRLRELNPFAVIVFGLLVAGWIMRFWLWTPGIVNFAHHLTRGVHGGAATKTAA